MYVKIDISQVAFSEQYRVLCYLRQKFEAQRLSLLDHNPQDYYELFSQRTVSFLKELKAEKIQQLLALSRKDLSGKVARAVLDEIEQFLGAFGWEINK